MGYGLGLIFEIIEGIYYYFLEPGKNRHRSNLTSISKLILDSDFWES
jgi:hypothetical protein